MSDIDEKARNREYQRRHRERFADSGKCRCTILINDPDLVQVMDMEREKHKDANGDTLSRSKFLNKFIKSYLKLLGEKQKS